MYQIIRYKYKGRRPSRRVVPERRDGDRPDGSYRGVGTATVPTGRTGASGHTTARRAPVSKMRSRTPQLCKKSTKTKNRASAHTLRTSTREVDFSPNSLKPHPPAPRWAVGHATTLVSSDSARLVLTPTLALLGLGAHVCDAGHLVWAADGHLLPTPRVGTGRFRQLPN